MAKVTLGPIVSSISGRIGSVIFSRSRQGFSAYSNSHNSCKPRGRNAQQQEYFRHANETWSALPANIRKYWDFAAKSATKYNPVYAASMFTGREYFLKHILTQRACGHFPVYAFGGPNQATLGVMNYGNVLFATSFLGTAIVPYSLWVPQPKLPVTWGMSLSIGFSIPFTKFMSASQAPAPGPLPRKWYHVWPPTPDPTPYPLLGLDSAILAATGGFRGVDYSVPGTYNLNTTIWIRFTAFCDLALYDSGPLPVFARSAWAGVQPHIHITSPLHPTSGTYTPSWAP